MDGGHFSVSKANYLALLALPEPPLRDCYPATFVFRQQEDWPALAKALEAAGETLQRVMAAPAEEFVKAMTDPLPEDGPAVGQPHVYVQDDFSGIWRLKQGTVGDWLPVLKTAQQSLKRDCAGIYLELGGLYANKLQQPKNALHAYRQAVAQQPFCAEPLDTLVPKVWPTPKVKRDVLWANRGITESCV